MARQVKMDYLHSYQPTTFNDLGEERHSSHGYSWKRGNVLLEGARKDLLEKLPAVDIVKPGSLRRDIEIEASWAILEHLNTPLEKAEESEPSNAYMPLLGNDVHIQETLDFAVNSALYTNRRSPNPGFLRGNSILLGELKNPQSVAYNIGRPEFKKRVINAAFWEQIGNGSSPELEAILSQEAVSLDPSFSDAGWKILELNNEGTLGFPHSGFDFYSLSKGSMVNFAHHVNALKQQGIDPRFKKEFQKIFVTDYMKALDNEDHWDNPYFYGKEKEHLQKLVSN